MCGLDIRFAVGDFMIDCHSRDTNQEAFSGWFALSCDNRKPTWRVLKVALQ